MINNKIFTIGMAVAFLLAFNLLSATIVLAVEPATPFSSLSDCPVSVDDLYGFHEIAAAVKNRLPQTGPLAHPASATSFVVTGDACFSGSFELDGPVDVLTAIFATGGPTGCGSMRQILVSHGGTHLGGFDLYDFLETGSLKNDFILNGGELISIAPRGAIVKVAGQVVRPCSYELVHEEMNLKTILTFAKGLANGITRYRLELLRSFAGRQRAVLDQEMTGGDPLPDFPLLDGDVVNFIRSGDVAALFYTMEGHVVTPQQLIYRKYIKVSDVLINHVHFKDGAALDYAEMLREGGPDHTYQVIGFSPADILAGAPNADFSLQPGDRLVFFPESFLRKAAVIALTGAVNRPGKHNLQRGMTVRHLIEQGGGLKRSRAACAELTRRFLQDGKLRVVRLEVDLRQALTGAKQQNILLQPFDILHIP